MANNFQRVLGIDYGTVRVGVAVSDPLRILARALETIERQGDDQKVIDRILEIIKEYDVATLVLGLPLRTDDQVGEKEIEARAFAEKLEKASGIKPILQDERYTTVMAHEIMHEAKIKEKDRKKLVDQIAAEIILQDYLNAHN